MNAKRSLRWTGYYCALAALATLAGGMLVAAGLLVGGVGTYQAVLAGDAALSGASLVGLVTMLLGAVVWWFGRTWAFYWALTNATEDALSQTYDTERVKSEMLSVLDERLAEIQDDVRTVNRNVQKARTDADPGEDASFEFGD